MNVYDFDNTIYDGESCFDLFKFYIKRRPSLLRHAPQVIFAFAKYKLGKVTIEQALSKYGAKVGSFFRSIPDLQADSEKFWDEHMHNIKPFYKELQQEDDLVITASPEATMRVICRRLGIKNLLGSTVDENSGEITRLCMSTNKVKAFFEAYPDGKIDCFYTDSVKNDSPLIDIAQKAFVVKGNKITQIK